MLNEYGVDVYHFREKLRREALDKLPHMHGGWSESRKARFAEEYVNDRISDYTLPPSVMHCACCGKSR